MHRFPPRFIARFKVNPDTGCWVWQGYINPNKYGHYRVGGRGTRLVRAHKFAWELVNGPISDPALYVCHKCDNPRCVNPEHLFLGTNRENQLDRKAKGEAGVLPPVKLPPGRPRRK